ncbi:MAG: hypothetical protein Q7R65_00290 [bacterium]|nr:hypothetical protein [bacterium]
MGLYFGTVFASSFFVPYFVLLWQKPGELAMGSPFADMRQMTSAFECSRLGNDVLIENLCDPWKRPFDYPRVWTILSTLNIGEQNTIPLGVLAVSLFFVAVYFVIGFLNNAEVVVYLMILLSPSALLAVERGNNDLIIFFLSVMSLLAISSRRSLIQIFGYFLLFLSAILKLYPIAALVVAFREGRKKALVITSFLLFCFAFYVGATLGDIHVIVQHLQIVDPGYAYGTAAIFLLSGHFWSTLLPPFFLKIAGFLFLTLTIFVTIFFFKKWRKFFGIEEISDIYYERFIHACFIFGAGIYTSTYLLGLNYDYRLIFLILTVPELLLWIKRNDQASVYASLALLGIVATLWLSRWSYHLFYVDEAVNFTLFVYFLSYLLGFLSTRIQAKTVPS